MTVLRWMVAAAILMLLAAEAPAQKVPGVERDGGVFFEGDAAISLLEALRDGESSQKKVEALLEQARARDQQIAEMESSKRSADVAVGKAEIIIDNWKLIDETRRAVVDEYKTALQQVRETNEQLTKTVRETENARWWDKVWSTIIVGIVGAVGFMH